MPRIKVAIAGCGRVSEPYLADLRQSPHVELVSVCDVVPERAARRAEEFGVPHHFGDFDHMLSGPQFDLLVNLTAMPHHFPLNLKALQAGRHVFCEKPIATTLADGRRLLEETAARGVQLFGAPNVVTSPAFRCIAGVLAAGEIGRVHAAHGRYGHSGPTWGPWFYQRGGGSLFDLGVYNITTLTGLLGPARGVTALSGIVIPERMVEGERVRVEADDNTMLLMDHGDAVFSCVQTGFVYRAHRSDRTVELIGTRGCVNLLGHDWGPKGVEVWTEAGNDWETRGEDQQGYGWQRGAGYVAECLATGKPCAMTGEHAFHVLEVMLAALKSAGTGQRAAIGSRFPWPIGKSGCAEAPTNSTTSRDTEGRPGRRFC
jgi:predicted dehydrogenase